MVNSAPEVNVRQIKRTDRAALLELEIRNRGFFDQYAATRSNFFYTQHAQKKRIRSFLAHSRKGDGFLFAVTLTASGELIGLIMVTEVLRGNLQSAWLGYFLDQAHNGRGYMPIAVRQVLAYCFERLQLHRIEAGVMPSNKRSMQVLRKCGFQNEGLAHKNVKVAGEWQDHYTFAILAEDFKRMVEKE